MGGFCGFVVCYLLSHWGHSFSIMDRKTVWDHGQLADWLGGAVFTHLLE